jgi:hypothetical protein
MGFASAYLKERALFPLLITEPPAENTGIIVVIPAYDEPQITDLLDSLVLCEKPSCGIEVIIIVNAPAGVSSESILHNSLTISNSENWKKNHPECLFKLFLVDVTDREPEGWGVGLARKTGMDEAVRRFEMLDEPEGIILSLDADCKVENNYFTAVYEAMYRKKNHSACSIYFEHPLSGTEYPPEIYRSVILYELHLRYFYQGLAYSRFPYVHHTVGSAIAVKVLLYVKSGGMNRRLAGEDFYFIQKLVPSGGYFNLLSTTVFPSPRLSSRVPFGTGITLAKLTGSENKILLTYNFDAFRELRFLFDVIGLMFSCQSDKQAYNWHDLPPGIGSFIGLTTWTSKINEIKRNTSGIESFRKRFFNWFNMFMIVKYLNAVHLSTFNKKPIENSAGELLEAAGYKFKSVDATDLLQFFRSLELTS